MQLSDRATRIFADYDTQPLSASEELRLIKMAQNGDVDAFQEIVRRNVRFVISTAQSYWSEDSFFDADDLVSEGFLGLARAIETYDLESGFKLITYAVWWIRQTITNYIERNTGIVRRPLGRRNVRLKIDRHIQRLVAQRGQRPSAGELASLTGLHEQRIEETMALPTTDLSMETPVKHTPGDEDYTLEKEVLIDEHTPDEPLHNDQRRDLLASCVDLLTARELQIIRMHYGLEGDQEHNLSEIAAVLGCSRERVRQIRNEALKKMREAHDWVVLT